MAITIVADENIARAEEALSPFGNVRLKRGRDIIREDLVDADALVVRSVTRVDRTLLEGTPVRFVGTATIGTDHIDFGFLNERHIAFADAAGGGARSVSEYVVAALLELRRRGKLELQGGRLGVIGVGAIGSLVVRFGRLLGMEVCGFDPPRERIDSSFSSCALSEAMSADALVLAVPLTRDGDHPTYHLVDDPFLSGMNPDALLINVSRGGVVDSDALVRGVRSGRPAGAVLDVWEAEPEVPQELLDTSELMTPHIAGYSRDGKLRGTEMMAEGIAQFLGVENRWRVERVLPAEAGRLELSGLELLEAAEALVSAAYDIGRDDGDLRSVSGRSDKERRRQFDCLRKNYRERREFPAWSFTTDNEETGKMLEGLGFVGVR